MDRQVLKSAPEEDVKSNGGVIVGACFFFPILFLHFLQ